MNFLFRDFMNLLNTKSHCNIYTDILYNLADCFCSDPPSVSNGEVKYAGPYSNGSRAEYDCDTG